jgi:putative methionine-R-sulfoxide reductase with GAF domain
MRWGRAAVLGAIVSEDKNKLVFDENTLAKLLEAAYVLQEHRHALRNLDPLSPPKMDRVSPPADVAAPSIPVPEKVPTEFNPSQQPENGDYSSALGQIVETQHRIELNHLNGETALSVVAAQLIEICGAAGAAIGILQGNTVRYRAIAGMRALPLGSEVPLDKALCASSIRTGEVFSCPNVNPQSQGDPGECRRRGIGSLIIVPVLREGEVIGALELYYSDPRAFSEHDVNTCQLMAGLVSEALTRDNEPSTRPENGRSAVPNPPDDDKADLFRKALVEEANQISSTAPATAVCSKCGHKLVGDEQFCGECGTPRKKDAQPVNPPSLAVPLWLQKTRKRDAAARPSEKEPARPQKEPAPAEKEPVPEVLPELAQKGSSGVVSVDHSTEAIAASSPASNHPSLKTSEQPLALPPAETTPEKVKEPSNPQEKVKETVNPEVQKEITEQAPAPAPDWSSALSARQFLEQLSGGTRKGSLIQFWNARRGDIYLGIAVILVVCVIRWAIWSTHPVKATAPPVPAASRKPPAAPELPLFDRMLISLGLAEAPEPPEDKGNPGAQVWVDLRTGLYYCPSTDLFGKTPKGKYTTQRDAQLDQFQPAYRKACD